MIEIKSGDLVRLKSGSPKMQVMDIKTTTDGTDVDVFFWSDQIGFVEDTVPIECLVAPYSLGNQP